MWSASPETAQLLLIVSDGRGMFVEGRDRVTAAVRAAQTANVFIIFVVIDSPNSRVSEEKSDWKKKKSDINWHLDWVNPGLCFRTLFWTSRCLYSRIPARCQRSTHTWMSSLSPSTSFWGTSMPCLRPWVMHWDSGLNWSQQLTSQGVTSPSERD